MTLKQYRYLRFIILLLLTLHFGFTEGLQSSVKAKPVEDSPFLPGQIIHDPARQSQLVYNRDENQDGNLDPFMMCGLGDPEGFLFLGPRQADGTVTGGKQESILEALIRHGGYSIYVESVRTHGGDAKGNNDPGWQFENPFIDGDPKNGLDEDILTQWESWFTTADEAGIVVYFFFYDDAAQPFGKGLGEVSVGERDFFVSLVKRFKHHKHLIWCIEEEYEDSMNETHASALAAIIRAADDYRHIISVHHATGDNTMNFRDDANISQFALQTSSSSIPKLHNDVLEAFHDAAGRWHVNMAENWNERRGDHSIAMKNGDRSGVRRRNWATAMAGAHVMTIGAWVDSVPSPEILGDMRRLQQFFEATPFNITVPMDEKVFTGTLWLLADPGNQHFIAYAYGNPRYMGIRNMNAGRYHLDWFDCETGERLEETKTVAESGSDQSWKKPIKLGGEVGLYVRRIEL